jgi:TFIIF-interacting CTD phosphatase-like protein
MLDLDETLVRSERKECVGNNEYVYSLALRPYLMSFLTNMSKLYEIYVYTASHRCYAEAVVQ